MGSILKIFDDPELVLLAGMILALTCLGIVSRWLFGPDDAVANGVLGIATLFAGGFAAAIRQDKKVGSSEPEKPADG